MMEKFTKGEWFSSIDGCVYAKVGGDCKRIAHVSSVNVFANHEEKSNKHLIAAAPDMYSMLSRVDEYFESMAGEYSYSQSLHDEIIGLLAKARGES